MEGIANLITDSHESLARSVAEGFAGVANRFDDMETRLSQQISGINNRIDDLALNRATRDELLLLDKRMIRVENKLGIDFKKPQHV